MAEMIACAAFEDGKYAQAFPYLGGGGERRGAPVQAFVRISDASIQLREKVQNPNIVIIQDPSIMDAVDVLKGMTQNGQVLFNSEQAVPIDRTDLKVWNIPATRIAIETLGKPVMNTALLGALAAITSIISLKSIELAIRKKFSGNVAEQNIAAVRRAFCYMGGIIP
jgi:pyruvate ferredoxin oxidoreductase gamma subunit